MFHAQHRTVTDGWIEHRVSPRTACLFKALRLQLSELLRERIADADESSRCRACYYYYSVRSKKISSVQFPHCFQ